VGNDVGHWRLLLRSTKAQDADTRIDILFKNVMAICLPAWFDGLELEQVDAASVPGISGVTRADLLLNTSVYTATGTDGTAGFVVCDSWSHTRT
jgi:hypothetical protein